MNTTILSQVEAVAARTKKEKLLATLQDDTTRFLQLVADPFITFGHTVDDQRVERLIKHLADRCQVHKVGSQKFWNMLFAVLYGLQTRHLSGNKATEIVDKTLSCAPDRDALVWAARVINKDLRLGVGTRTFLKVWPGLVTPFQVQLAHPYDPGKHKLEGSWAMEPKLDGLRMVVVDGKAYTRNGKEITSCAHILKQLEGAGAEAYVLDGEVMGAEFNETSGQVRKSEACETLVYHVFDCVNRSQWTTRKTEEDFGLRRLDLEELLAHAQERAMPNVAMVQHFTLPKNPTVEDIFLARDKFIAAGYEGIMLKNLHAPYCFKRTSDLLKVKDFHDADGRVVGTFEGKGKFKGMLGGLDVDFNGVVTQVGSGFADHQRTMYWQNKLSVIGKMVEVKYQNKTPDGKLRFGVFIRFRPDKDSSQ
ncbi:MAG: hypothetical protein A2Y38_17240 [Spirochaetes bacterium GWB1_59_5]|nr:MAG: hypothetical protein A2Y38_17240 [Spirochaetes bacterium GWB1_59_5]